MVGFSRTLARLQRSIVSFSVSRSGRAALVEERAAAVRAWPHRSRSARGRDLNRLTTIRSETHRLNCTGCTRTTRQSRWPRCQPGYSFSRHRGPRQWAVGRDTRLGLHCRPRDVRHFCSQGAAQMNGLEARRLACSLNPRGRRCVRTPCAMVPRPRRAFSYELAAWADPSA